MENNKFEWTDNAVLEFLTYQSNEWPQVAERRKALEEFKKSKEPVPEWEILTMINDNEPAAWPHPLGVTCEPHKCKIHSIKRLSDGEVFTIGDVIIHRYGDFKVPILHFNIEKGYMYANYKKGQTKECALSYIEKVKEPELQWFVIPQNTSVPLNSIPGWTPIKQKIGNMGGYANCQYFPDEESANAFIINNKPCLSVKEVNYLFTKRTGYGMGIENFLDLKEIVKSKL